MGGPCCEDLLTAFSREMPFVPLKKKPVPSGFRASMEAQKIGETHTHTL